nr:MAG TPA: hypothetical protein [Caudoviricetes sp.]
MVSLFNVTYNPEVEDLLVVRNYPCCLVYSLFLYFTMNCYLCNQDEEDS